MDREENKNGVLNLWHSWYYIFFLKYGLTNFYILFFSVNPMFHNNNHNIIINNNHNIKNLQVDQTASLIPIRVNCTTRGEQNGMLPITINTDRVLPELRVQLKLWIIAAAAGQLTWPKAAEDCHTKTIFDTSLKNLSWN